jgi:hypothetical protein
MRTNTSSLMDGKYYKENKVMRIDEINAMADSDIRENEHVEKLKDAYINGYNKAKETLYTEEQVREAMEFARGHSKMTDTQFIKQFKTK